MTKQHLFGASFAVLLLAAPACAFAGDDDKSTDVSEVVATASRDGGVRRDLIGGSATVLTIDDLEQRGARVVGDVLRDVPGVEVSRSGPAGTQTDIRIRGAEANHTLVLVDGINIASPVGRQVDFSSLLVEDGAKIEVLRGQQSSLYGSEAIGGVIQYFTPDGKSSPGLRVRGEYGSFGTTNGSVQYGAAGEKFDLSITASDFRTDGTTNTRAALRDLSYDNQVLSVKAKYAFTDTLRLAAVLRGARASGETNGGSDNNGVLLDNADYYRSNSLVGKIELQSEMLDGRWTHSLGVQGARSSSDGVYGTATIVPSGPAFPGAFANSGKRVKASYVTAFSFGSDRFRQKLTGAIDLQRERMKQEGDPVTRSLETTAFVGVYDLVIDGNTALGAAVRNDANDRFASFTSYRVQATHKFPTGTRIRAAAGSGIQYPNQYELFGYSGTYLGNPNLRPEKSEGWEVGVEQSFGENILVGIAYFDNELTDQITSTGFPVTTPTNSAGKSQQKGVELFAEVELGDAWKIDASYTNLDGTTGTPPAATLRRADDIASVNVNWQATDDVRVNLNVRYNGEQFDNSFGGPPFYLVTRQTLPAYTLVGLNVDWKLKDNLTVYARADNLFDETYEEVYSYRGSGRELSVGLKAKF